MAGRAVLSDDEEDVQEEESRAEGDAVDPDEREADDDEDEEDDKGQDEYENDGFIVDDEEEVEERDDSDEEWHKKRKKKRRESERNYVLDEDDYELLQDNNITGFAGPNSYNKFKRLKKAGRDADAEELSGFSDEEESDKNSKGGRTAEEKLKRRLFGDDEAVPLEDIAEEEEQPEEDLGGEDIIGEGEDDEMADFIVDEEDVDENGVVVRRRKSVKKKKSRQAPGISSSALQEAHDIFGDPDELIRVRKKDIAAETGDTRLEDEFEPFILSEKYMMPKDDHMRDTDIPERIQMAEDFTGPPPTDDKSIEEESTWIYNQLIAGVNSLLPDLDDVVREINKEEIGNVLTMMHVQKFEVPFIAMYRKELCASLLKDPNYDVKDGEQPKLRWHKVLWAIHTLDRK